MYIENNITRNLDSLLENSNKNNFSHCVWTSITMLPGFGVTSSIKGWLEHHNLKHLYVNASVKNVTKLKVECFKKVSNSASIRIVSNDELAKLLSPIEKEVNVLFTSEELDYIDEDTILIIDDYLRTSEETRKELFNVIRYEKFIDIRYTETECERRIKPKMMVVVLDEFHIDKLTDEEKRLFEI